MQGNTIIHHLRKAFRGRVYQSLTILFCVLFGIAMIVNTQMGGEAEWFWYARLLHNGTKLYADLHFALQPLYVLLTDAWIQLFGIKCIVTEIPSVIEVLALSVSIFLILQESDWPDWQRAVVLSSAFLICVECAAYRFDDFHVLSETLSFYSLWMLLKVAKAETQRQQLGLAAGLGVLSGLAVTTRLNDGAALLVASMVCLLFLARKRKLPVSGLFLIVAALTVVFVVKLTGDSLSAYASNSIVKAAGAKGGAGTLLIAPFRLFISAREMFHGRRWIFFWLVAMFATSALIQRYLKKGTKYIVLVQFAIAGAAYAISSNYHQEQLKSGVFISYLSVFLIVANYLLLPLVSMRFLTSDTGFGKREWDTREILILLPLAALVSMSTSTAGHTTSIFLAPIAMLLLLIPTIQPFGRQASWANVSLLTIMALLSLSVTTEKIHNPYSWILYGSSPMFVNREWYRHPVYGPMYIDRDLLNFIEPVCREIRQGSPKPDGLLSMPFSYPNYFCDIPPWHGYVQTFFDTITRPAVYQLMNELDTAPPQWIVYQRQIKVMNGLEKIYGNGQRLAHRDLDDMMMKKIATGQWQVVDKSRYLEGSLHSYQEGDGWLIIRTHP